jgi:hypothetical protein
MRFIFPLFFILLFTSCRKDVIKNGTIDGTVFNLCTDKGIEGVKVYFTVIHNKRLGSDKVTTLETLSGTNGIFTFSNIDLYTNDRYVYELATESASGIGSNETGFDGAEIVLENDKLHNHHILNVVPRFTRMCVQINPPVHITYPDTISVSIEQRIFHKNVPDLPYGSTITTVALQEGSAPCSGNYPMGWWNITIDKTKGGVQTITQDSVYIDWKETKTYTINW